MSQRCCAALTVGLPVVLGCGTPVLGLFIERTSRLCETRGLTEQNVLRRVARASSQRHAVDWGREGVEEGRQKVTEGRAEKQGRSAGEERVADSSSNLDKRHN